MVVVMDMMVMMKVVLMAMMMVVMIMVIMMMVVVVIRMMRVMAKKIRRNLPLCPAVLLPPFQFGCSRRSLEDP